MLSVKVEPGQNLDKSLAASSAALKALLRRADEAGFLRIVALPSSESLVAALTLFSYLSRRGIKASISVSVRPPSRVDERHLRQR